MLNSLLAPCHPRLLPLLALILPTLQIALALVLLVLARFNARKSRRRSGRRKRINSIVYRSAADATDHDAHAGEVRFHRLLHPPKILETTLLIPFDAVALNRMIWPSHVAKLSELQIL